MPRGRKKLRIAETAPPPQPDGPRDLRGILHEFASSAWAQLDEEAQDRVRSTWAGQKLYMGSFYSGWDSYTHGSAQVLEASGLEQAVFFHANEIVPARQEFIRAHPPKTRPQHLFADHQLYFQPETIEHAHTDSI